MKLKRIEQLRSGDTLERGGSLFNIGSINLKERKVSGICLLTSERLSVPESAILGMNILGKEKENIKPARGWLARKIMRERKEKKRYAV